MGGRVIDDGKEQGNKGSESPTGACGSLQPIRSIEVPDQGSVQLLRRVVSLEASEFMCRSLVIS